MSLSVNYPTTRPSLLLDFLNTQALDPRITFTRATSATYFDAAGVLRSAPAGQARFDYNPSTLTPLGLLIEEQRTNLFTWSEQLENAAWTNANNTVTANAIISPDGTQDADKIVENTAASVPHEIRTPSVTLTSGVTYTVSVYAKIGERRYLRIGYAGVWGTGNNYAVFDLQDGSNTYKANASLVTTSTPVGNGWYRLTVTYAVTATSAGTLYFGINIDSTTGTIYTGDGTSGLFLWGAQIEVGSFSTSYIPTETVAVTRNADAASMTGVNFSSWYNAGEGTLYGEGISSAFNSAIASIANAAAGTFLNANQFSVRYASGTPGANTRFSGSALDSVQFDISIASSTFGTNRKLALAIKVNDVAASTNGSAVSTDTSAIMPVGVNQLQIGSATFAAAGYYCGTIKKIAYYPFRLTNAQLQALTS